MSQLHPPPKVCNCCGHRFTESEWREAPLVAAAWTLGAETYEARNCPRDGSTLMRRLQ